MPLDNPNCNPWTPAAAPSFSPWQVQAVDSLGSWLISGAAHPTIGWNESGYDVRRTEENCERITEDGQLRIIE
jgi:hypothetical protein